MVRVYDYDSNPPIAITALQLSGNRRNGWDASFEVLDDMSLTEVPDGAMMAIFSREYRDGSWNAQIGSEDSGRSQIECLGFLRRESNTSEGGLEKTNFSLQSPLDRLDEIAGYSKWFEVMASGASWQVFEDLSVFIAMVQILRWYTTFLDIFSLSKSFTDLTYAGFIIQAQTPLAQIRELADGLDCEVSMARNGKLLIYQNPRLMELADR